MIRKTFVLLGLLAFALSGCYYDIEEELYPAPCFVPEEVNYDIHIEPIVQANCATSGCHAAGGNGPGNFTSFDGLLPYLEDGSFENEVIELRTMPPNGELAPCETQLINAWLQAGFPE